MTSAGASRPDWDLLSSYTGLLVLAGTSIYAGAYGSLPNHTRDSSGKDEDQEEDDGERMSAGDAWLFPVIGSIALGGLYAAIKYFGKDWINWLLSWYFSVAGLGSVWQSSISLGRYLIGEVRWKQFDNCDLIVNRGNKRIIHVSGRIFSLYLLPVALLTSGFYTFWPGERRPVLATNMIALSFSHNALTLLKIDSFKTGAILLSGLFVYDLWWVFGTEVMVQVATTLDVPIKLLWPKSRSFSGTHGYTMLGLGDVVVPGTFVALALRYDYFRYRRSRSQSAESAADLGKGITGVATDEKVNGSSCSKSDSVSLANDENGFRRPYFCGALCAYIVGLLATMTVMHTIGKAQPALLYLSPACILSFVVTAGVRGELKEAWGWSDDPEMASKEGDKVEKEER